MWGWPRPGTHSAPVAITSRWRLWTLERNATSPWDWPGRWAQVLSFSLWGQFGDIGMGQEALGKPWAGDYRGKVVS